VLRGGAARYGWDDGGDDRGEGRQVVDGVAMTKLQDLLIAISLARGLCEAAAAAKTAETLAKIRRGLFERQVAKHYRWFEFQRELHPSVDVRALVRRHYRLSKDAELNAVQQRVAELLAGARKTAKKDWKEEAAVKAKEWIETNLLPKRSRGRPNGAGKAQPIELRPPGFTKPVKLLDVCPTIAEVIEVVVPAVQEHANGRIDMTRGLARGALGEAILSLVSDPNDPSRAKNQKNSVSREVRAYFSKNIMS
jgi:hypothetical protein